MEKKYQVFLSSTYKDLIQEREMVLKTILSMYHIPIGMELFSAADDDQWQIIKSTIDYSDYYILILGHRYGSVDNIGIGFTEKEYDYALQKKIPILSFVLDDKAPRTNEQREVEPDLVLKYNSFRDKVLNNSKMSEFWIHPDELGRKVAVALMKAFKSNPGIGWIRSDNAASPEVLEEFALLSKENRDLRNQISSLLTETSRKPDLQCSIKSESLIFVKSLNLSFPDFIQEITMQEIPLNKREFITENDIHTYNNLVKSNQKVIDDYNEKSILYNRIESQRFSISIDINNNGTLKAHSIYIYLFFPREIILVETSSDELDFKKPNIPIDTKLYPIYVANRKIESLTTKIVKQSRIRDYVLPIYPQIVHSSLSTQSLASQKNNWCTVNRDTNSIKIYIKDLLHKITISFDDEISIIPLIGGNLEIKGNIICEEYTSKEEFTLNINIKEQ